MTESAKRAAPAPAGRARRTDAIERLYVYWILSTALLLLVVIIATLYMRGRLYSQAMEYNRSLSELGERLAALEQRVANLPAARGGARSRTNAVTTQPAAPAEQQSPPEELPPGAPEAQPTPRERPIPSGRDMQAQLDQALVAGGVWAYAIEDAGAVDALLQQALDHIDRADWPGEVWAELAVAARLRGRDAAAEALARRAVEAGASLRAFSELSTRALLAARRPDNAQVHAQYFAQQSEQSPGARALLAHVAVALHDPAGADALMHSVNDVEPLSTLERLTLARVAFDLHAWERLGRIMPSLADVPQDLQLARNFLQAVSNVQSGERLAEAYSILEYLAEQLAERGRAQPDRITASLQPTPQEIATWQGVALMRGNQTESAREAFTHAISMSADRPEPSYWRAMLEIREGQYSAATDYLQNALAASARYAPAWEALALLSLNDGDVEGAVSLLERALDINPRLSSAHFLAALAHAKVQRRDAAAEALRTAIELDAGYLEKARRTPALSELFTEEELEALAAFPTTEPDQ